MENADSSKEKIQGFISKIEDWHRMMNFLEVHLPYTCTCYICHLINVSNVNQYLQ